MHEKNKEKKKIYKQDLQIPLPSELFWHGLRQKEKLSKCGVTDYNFYHSFMTLHVRILCILWCFVDAMLSDLYSF